MLEMGILVRRKGEGEWRWRILASLSQDYYSSTATRAFFSLCLTARR